MFQIQEHLFHVLFNFKHSFNLPNYTNKEFEELAKNKLEEYLEKKDINHIIKWFNESKECSKGNEGNTFRELLKTTKFTEKFSGIDNDYLLQLILSSNIQSSEINKFKNGYLINSSINLKKMEQKNNGENIYFQKMKNNINKIENKFTFSQKETINKIIIGIINDFTILLIGDIGAGKTFIIEELSRIFEVNLKVINLLLKLILLI